MSVYIWALQILSPNVNKKDSSDMEAKNPKNKKQKKYKAILDIQFELSKIAYTIPELKRIFSLSCSLES